MATLELLLRLNPEDEPPHALLPPHGAPLDMLYYQGSALPGLEGALLISYHGYRPTGHRVLAYDVDTRGVPARAPTARDVIVDWEAGDTGPRGSPVGMTQARDGSVWLVEDVNGTVLRLAVDRYAEHRAPSGAQADPSPTPAAGAVSAAFEEVYSRVLQPRCSPCHDHLTGGAATALAGMRREGWLRREGGRLRLSARLDRASDRPMPPDGPLSNSQRALLTAWLASRPGDVP